MTVAPAPRPARGFTLIELLVTLAVASIVVSIAAPSFRDLIVDSRRDTVIYQVIGDLQFARSEAIKRSSRLALCARSPAEVPACSAAADPDWSNGWLVFDDNGPTPGALDAADGETVLRVAQPIASSLEVSNLGRTGGGVQAPLPRPFVRFGPRGTSNWRGGGTFMICASEGTGAERDAEAIAVNVSLSGDIRRARRDASGSLIDAFGGTAGCPVAGGGG